MRAAGLLAAALALASGPAFAFGTVIGLGQNAEHGRITRSALVGFEPRSLAILIGPKGDRGAVSIPDLSTAALRSDAHCDNGDWLPGPYPRPAAEARAALEACRAGMEVAMAEAVGAAGGLVGPDGALDPAALGAACRFSGGDGAKCRTLTAFGRLLHASQDFYSHSNWTDRADPGRPVGLENPPGLGHSAPAPFIALRGPAAFPEGLISGCFKAVPERAFCSGRVRHAALNKDEGQVEPSLGLGATPRGRVDGNFARAAGAAIADTADKWVVLQARLAARYGERKGVLMACALSHDAPLRDCR